jgi:hypothetical protein
MARRSLPTRLLLSLLLLAALLGVVELALRIGGGPADDGFRFRRIAPAVAEDRQGRYEAHARRYYTLAPGFRHSPTHLGRDATGTWPFRGRPPEPAPPGLLRVALVGDSVVYGSSLDAADMPASRLADALARRGWTPDRVAVVSLGVPGYSTVQLALLLDEALAGRPYDAVVLWPAAWNDQAPALVAPDAELLADLADTSLLEWLRERSRLAALVRRRDKPDDIEAIVEAWRHGAPPHGWRVPARGRRPERRRHAAALRGGRSAGSCAGLGPSAPDRCREPAHSTRRRPRSPPLPARRARRSSTRRPCSTAAVSTRAAVRRLRASIARGNRTARRGPGRRAAPAARRPPRGRAGRRCDGRCASPAAAPRSRSSTCSRRTPRCWATPSCASRCRAGRAASRCPSCSWAALR